MAGTKSNYSPRRAGEVVGVEVRADDDRPVTITCYGHEHVYEIAWHDTADGPVITDLRVISRTGQPITSDSLRRINTDRLARTAALHDTASSTHAARRLRKAIDAATGTTEGHEWIDEFRFTDGVVDSMVKRAPPDAAVLARGGRPRHSREFLARVAGWAREASAQGHSIYPYVAQRAREVDGRITDDHHVTVKGWIRRCKDAGLLDRDELRRPRTPRIAASEDH